MVRWSYGLNGTESTGQGGLVKPSTFGIDIVSTVTLTFPCWDFYVTVFRIGSSERLDQEPPFRIRPNFVSVQLLMRREKVEVLSSLLWSFRSCHRNYVISLCTLISVRNGSGENE